ncbi:hypothetical protein LINGRAHAP2_LOCUS4036 [Linum grandiflorum]
MDLGFEGQRFTWTNYRNGNDNVKGRLDRALCTPTRRIHFHKAILYHEAMIGSDHTPLHLDTKGKSDYIHRPFRFDAKWLDFPTVEVILNDKWNKNNSSHDKMMGMQNKPKEWSRSAIRNAEKEIKRIKTIITTIQE